MNHVNIQMKTVGFYCTDSEDIYNGSTLRAVIEDKFTSYLPVVNLFNINQAAEVKFTNTINKGSEIVTYNKGVSTKNLDDSTIRSKRIDITQNDLFMGPVRMVLNFTSRPVTIGMGGELRKTFARLNQDKFTEQSGKLLVFSIYTLNTPSFIYDTYGNGNYLETMSNYLDGKVGEEVSEMREIYKYAESKWHKFKRLNNGCMPNSIKVICLHEIEEELLSAGNQQYITNLGWVIGNVDLVNLNDNPQTEINSFGNKDLRAAFERNSFLCYIVDNNDQISDRYINIAGHVRKISKVKNKAMVNGLYFVATDNDSSRDNEIICKLEDIDDSEYVYKSIEEANEGANVRQKYKDELDIAKAKLETAKIEASSEIIRIKADHERELGIVKAEAERNKAQREAESLDKKIDHENKKFNIDIEREQLRAELDFYKGTMDKGTMDKKYHYETKRYERDNFVETLKTVGAVAGLAATIFLVYKKANG